MPQCQTEVLWHNGGNICGIETVCTVINQWSLFDCFFIGKDNSLNMLEIAHTWKSCEITIKVCTHLRMTMLYSYLY